MESKLQNVNDGYAYNRDLILMTLPLFLMSFLYYGPRTLLLALVAAVLARLCDRVVALLRSRQYNKEDRSSVAFALLIVLMMPANVPFRVMVAAVLMAVLVAKEAFGGFGSYPFHPAAVGYCMAAVSWPEYLRQFPQLQVWFMNPPEDFASLWGLWNFQSAQLLNGPSYSLQTGGIPSTGLLNLFLGNYAGPLGVTSVLVILACGIFLLVRKRVNFITPLCFIGTAFLILFLFPRVSITPREGDIALLLQLRVVGYELFSGATIFAAFFLACDPGVQPQRAAARAVYGILLGIGTVMFRYNGNYDLGVCFALLIVNAFSGFIDRVGNKKPAPREEVVQL